MKLYEDYARRAAEEIFAANRAGTAEERALRRAQGVELLELRDQRAREIGIKPARPS